MTHPCGDNLNCNVGSVSILLGNGDGTFQAAVNYASGGNFPQSAAVGDVDGDGKPDLVVSNYCQSASNCPGPADVAVLIGNGDGTFQTAVVYDPGGQGTSAVAIADLNGDGKVDLVATNCGIPCSPVTIGNVGVLLGNGDGTFRKAFSYSAGTNPVTVVLADINGDGKSDVIVGNWGTRQARDENDGGVTVLLGNGDGTFGTAVTSPTGGAEVPSIAVADLNGDGKPDVVAASVDEQLTGATGVVSVLLNSTRDFTTTALASSLNPSIYGQKVTLTATVTSGAGTPPKGELVTFYNGSAVLGITTLHSGGVAALTTSSLAPGIYTITASYHGDSTFAPSTSPALKQVVNSTTKSATSTSFTSSLNPSIYGQKVSFTATVTTTGTVPPTGQVVFKWSVYTIGSATLDGNGVGTLTMSGLNAGMFPLIAVYKGDANNLGSTSTVVNQVVTQTTSAATITSSLNPAIVGQAVTFTAKIKSPTVIAKGPVTFTAGKTVLGTVQLSSGRATLTTSSLPAGSTVVKVIYQGDSDIKGSAASVTETVQ